MAWCRAYLSAKYLAWPQFTSTILGILVFFNCGKSTSHVCKWMHIYAHLHCILLYVNTCISARFGGGRGDFCMSRIELVLYQWSGTERCQSMHLYIFRTPFHWWWPISTCSAVVQLKLYFKVQLTFFFFFDELLCSETLFSSCWRHRKTFFMNSLFFYFLLQLVSCPVFLN